MSRLDEILEQYDIDREWEQREADNGKLPVEVSKITAKEDIRNLFFKLVGENKEQFIGMDRRMDDGESGDRFYRNGGYNFAKLEIRKRIDEETK